MIIQAITIIFYIESLVCQKWSEKFHIVAHRAIIIVRTTKTSTWSLTGVSLRKIYAFSRFYNRPRSWQGSRDWDSHARSRVAGTTDRVVHRPLATNRVKTRVKDHPTQTRKQAARRSNGRMKERNRIDAAYAAQRNHVDACWLWIRLSELFRAVRPLTVTHLHLYSCKIMSVTPDILATTCSFDTTSIMWEKSQRPRSIEI